LLSSPLARGEVRRVQALRLLAQGMDVGVREDVDAAVSVDSAKLAARKARRARNISWKSHQAWPIPEDQHNGFLRRFGCFNPFCFWERGTSEHESKAKYSHLSARSGGELKIKTE